MSRIKLTIENAGNVERKAWPITQGVPFAEGELECGAPVRVVDDNGQVLPTQSTCLATWSKNLKYVKWLLVDFQCDLTAGQTKEVFLEYVEGVESPQPNQPVTVNRQSRRIKLDTGTLRLEIRTGFPDFLAGCSVKTADGWRDVFRGRPGPYLYMTSAKGQVYDSYTAAPIPSITVEDDGPLRASVCVKGYHAEANGLHLCPYTLRIHACAGKNDLRFFHTFVFDQNPDVLEFSQVGMNFPLDLGDNLRMAFGGEDKTHFAKRWEHSRFLQSSDIAYQVTRDDEPFGNGEKTRGWATLCGSEASAFVAIRDFWQQYPKGYELTADGIDVQFWPESYGQPLVFSTPWKERAARFDGYYGGLTARAVSRDEATVKRILEEDPTAPINLKSFDVKTIDDILWIESMLDKCAPDRLASHNDTGTEDGTGAAKTHEFLMRFSADPINDEEAEILGVCVQESVIAPAEPAYICSTRAARDLFGGPDPRFAEIDDLLDGIVEKIAIEPMHLGRQWGFWRFGNMCCSHTAGAGLAYEAHYHTDPVKGLRHVGPYNNEADDPCWGVWTQFMRTGNRRFFLAASGFSRAMGDVGICHAHPAKPSAVGLMHYHSAHQWTGGHSPSHTLNTTLFLHYYLTGDRRMREIGLEVADWAVRNQEKAGIISNRHGRLNREFTGPLVCVIEAYLDTWAAKYGDLARRSLNWMLRTQEKTGIFPISVFTRGERGDEAVIEPTNVPLSHGGIVYPIFYEGLRHFDSPLLRETILAEADFSIATDAGGHVITACALAYEMTGDAIYAAFCKYVIENYKEYARTVVELTNNSIFSGIRNGYIAVLKSTVARAMDKDPEGFVEAEKRLNELLGKARRENSGPQPIPAERSLGIIQGYDCPRPQRPKSTGE